MSLRPLRTIEARPLLREVDEALIPLLEGLETADWQQPAVGEWRVRDVAAHLLDGSLRRLSLDRDGHHLSAPAGDLSEYRALVSFLNELNRTWIRAAERLSPVVLTELLAQVCPRVADYFESLDPEAEAVFPVSWAGEERSKVWMDVAREFTERWHHQQQIREAVGVDGLVGERYLRPLLETFVRALPRAYGSLEAPAGTRVELRIDDLDDLSWVLERQELGWILGRSDDEQISTAAIEMPAVTACRLFTKAASARTVRSLARVSGERALAEPFFSTLAIMA